MRKSNEETFTKYLQYARVGWLDLASKNTGYPVFAVSFVYEKKIVVEIWI
jgi:hypothetical protein